MGLEMESEFRKRRTEGLSPNTVLPSHRHCLDVEKRNAKPIRKDSRLSLKEDFREISFGRYRSSSCKNVPSRSVGMEGNIELKRGSIYQSSREVSKMKTRGSVEGRRKIEMPRGSDVTFSFRVVDSLCVSDEESRGERSSVRSRNSSLNAASVSKPDLEACSSDDFFEICLGSENAGEASKDGANCRGNKNVGPSNDGNELIEKPASFTLHKSSSANVGMPPLPSLFETDHPARASSKARFRPIKKMFDPFTKSKSMRIPLTDTPEVGMGKEIGIPNSKRKPLLDGFSKAPNLPDRQHSLVASSPVHLHGCLKLENKDGMPYFELSLKSPEDVFVAKTWKGDNAFNWVYTFHSIDNRKRSNASAWGSNDSNKESSMVGQMQVSCYLCSELRDDRASDNYMVTEFVLYDIGHARKSVAAQNCPSDVSKPAKGSEPDLAKVSPQPKQVLHHKELDSSYLNTWAPSDLHPDLEIAATVIQVPFKKRESLKHKRGDKIGHKMESNLLKLSNVEQKGRITDSIASPAKVKVVIPSGNHGLPSDESRGPSSLMDRWRLGGGCDCGGWDMACPLIVFANPDIQSKEDHLLVENQHPLELFVQGSKENAPALSLTFVKEGEYAVDFHAQLSTLQAFSICVAILHSSEASPDTGQGQERNMQFPRSSDLKMLIDEEEAKFLIKAVTGEEKKKVSKTRKDIPAASFVVNPPFSPIARV